MNPRNPPWKRDEVILALDLYFDARGAPRPNDGRVTELSKILKKLPIHSEEVRTDNFRNKSSVIMKCVNLQYLDPEIDGGLSAGSRLDKEIWIEFSNRREDLKKLALKIRKLTESKKSLLKEVEEINLSEEIDNEGVNEGKSFYGLHRLKERNSCIIRKKKLRNKDSLVCEVCGFDFSQTYGDLGSGFIECHHIKPISELSPDSRTTINDLALVCSNCHRMLHRNDLLSVEQLRSIISCA